MKGYNMEKKYDRRMMDAYASLAYWAGRFESEEKEKYNNVDGCSSELLDGIDDFIEKIPESLRESLIIGNSEYIARIKNHAKKVRTLEGKLYEQEVYGQEAKNDK